jgi:hypothetical protein
VWQTQWAAALASAQAAFEEGHPDLEKGNLRIIDP